MSYVAPGQSGVGHDVYGQCGDVSRFDHAPDREGGTKLSAPLFDLIAEERRRHFRQLTMGGPAPTGLREAAMCARSVFSAAT
jgi:hypothetical protein